MSELRPVASLTASLLARRGGARPAMRRAPLTGLMVHGPLNDDLGWNDLGEDVAEPAGLETNPVEPVEILPEPVAVVETRAPILGELSALADRIRDSVFEKPRPRVAPRPATLHGMKEKVAFTLRLDAPRHLRLRLLSAVSQRSAQQLLVEALDELFEAHDQVRALAEQIETDKTRSTRS